MPEKTVGLLIPANIALNNGFIIIYIAFRFQIIVFFQDSEN